MKARATLLLSAVMGSSVLAQNTPSRPLTANDVHREEQAVARELLTHDQLSPAEISRVLTASYAAMNGRTFRLICLKQRCSNEAILREVQMGPAGRPRYQYDNDYSWHSEVFYDYTGQRAHSCSGGSVTGEFVIGYYVEHDGMNPVDRAVLPDDGFVPDGAGGRIRVAGTEWDAYWPLQDEFATYTHARPLTAGRVATIDGHVARAFTTHAEWHVMDGAGNPVPVPPELEDWIWIDVESLFLVRWEMRRGGESFDFGMGFSEAPNRQLHPPALPKSLTLPTCVPWSQSR